MSISTVVKAGLCCATLMGAGVAAAAPQQAPIVVQGAMSSEIDTLIKQLKDAKPMTIGKWQFWQGQLDGYPVIVSKTDIGMENASAATALAAATFHPVAIINQGTAGGHDPELHNYDIVIGKESINIGSFKTPFKARGEGTHADTWAPMDLLTEEEDTSDKIVDKPMRAFPADTGLLKAAHRAAEHYSRGKVVDGVIASSDVWNNELDRIALFHQQYGSSMEEMETAAAAQIARGFNIPFMGVRVITNNATNGSQFEPATSEASQLFTTDIVKAYIHQLKR
ncbi:5'-methylthioadenosine/S-adenosylhomocysteine nucleosidase [Zymobacter palmae]|uniref:Nucleoside phosphorylase n=1 Tax=Zymobacter palmae TaxID=33074 RepID=A0A348HD65_9GAMM|nr:5'-methylthioadenosine/S-adenosylhomocysteine nucleosidase [Zymobacter palmae]BBG29567.1 nucleoside phosphorylase [Zymobacter palmae]